MSSGEFDVVTGAFGFTGKHIARRLLEMGRSVKTLTGHPHAEPLPKGIETIAFHFDRPQEMARAIQGARTFYNTYWIRFEHGEATFAKAVENSAALIQAARQAGVKRFVQISAVNPSLDSPYPYYRGKAQVEQMLRESGLSHAVIRPTLVFGPDDVMINNIAWHLRHFPLFAIFGTGQCLVEPVFVGDVADLAVQAARGERDLVADAAGPDTLTFEEMVRLLREEIGSRTRLIHLSPERTLAITRLSGKIVNDIILTEDEVGTLMANLLVSHDPPRCRTHLRDWLRENSQEVGAHYHSELARHYRPPLAAR